MMFFIDGLIGVAMQASTEIKMKKARWRQAVVRHKVKVRVIDRWAHVFFRGEFQFSCHVDFLWKMLNVWYRKKENEIIKGDLWVR